MSPSSSSSSSPPPALPNEVWVDVLRYLQLDTLWYSTRPVCSFFYHVSTAIVKSALVDGSTCELRHYISFKDPLLSEHLHSPLQHTDFQRRILAQEGHSELSQILLWASSGQSPANPPVGPGIPTVNYESADGKKCVTMAVFGQQERWSGTSPSSFHCRRTGCGVSEEDSVTDGHVCLAGCWHVHYSRMDRTFYATIPLANLLPIYLRLDLARREKETVTERGGYSGLERKGRWNGNVWSRHGVSASVSPFTDIDSMMDNVLAMNQPLIDDDADEGDEGQGTLMDWSEDEEGFLTSLFE